MKLLSMIAIAILASCKVVKPGEYKVQWVRQHHGKQVVKFEGIKTTFITTDSLYRGATVKIGKQ